LVTAIDQVWRGQSYISPNFLPKDGVGPPAQPRKPAKSLTSRQNDIVQLFAEGYGLKEIAARLNLSLKTVEFHKHHIMEAFNLKSNADLVLFALKRGLITLDPEPCPRALAS
jgi:DNA-binding NarL/FixJ family response regulator